MENQTKTPEILNVTLRVPDTVQAIQVVRNTESIKKALLFARGDESLFGEHEVNDCLYRGGVLIWDTISNQAVTVPFGNYIIRSIRREGYFAFTHCSAEEFNQKYQVINVD